MFPITIVSPKFTKLMSIFIDVYAITIFPFIISKEKMDKVTLNHEKIHIQQQKEMLVIFFSTNEKKPTPMMHPTSRIRLLIILPIMSASTEKFVHLSPQSW